VDRLGASGTPFAFGLSFVPPEALAPVSAGHAGPAEALVAACVGLSASFAFVPADAPWAEDAVEMLAAAGIAPLWAVDGPLWPVIEARGAIDGLRATLTHPEEVGAELDAGLDRVVHEMSRGAESGVRAIVLAEDLAGTEGPLVAPDFAIAELLPRYERVTRIARALGIPVVLHSDGDIRPLIPAIARAGFSAVHAGGGLGFEAFDRVFWAARDVGLAVMGGLLTAELGNPARAEAIGSTVGVLAQAGGLFVADDGGITTSAEMANLVSALAAARDV
jgi:uroporphyrinogen decarboxylase